MSDKKEPWEFEHHVLVGSELKAIVSRLRELVTDLGAAYPLNAKSKVRGRAYKALDGVDSLRCALDSQLATDHRERFDTRVYYGPEPWTSDAGTTNRSHGDAER